ncbi:MAG: pitrilysin family protein [Syntrophobacteraceae bacterium]
MKKAGLFWLALLLALLPSVSPGQTIRDVSETRLSNGLKVILLENHKAPIVTFQVWYRAGGRNERVGRTGLAHLLEHMMFKGTRKVSGEEFHKIVNENGAEQNAFTSHDFAAYFETLRSDRVGVPLRLEPDRMSNLVLRESDFKTERLVVIEERRMRVDDNPNAALLEQLEAAAFVSQPYHWPVIGWVEDIERLTLKDVQTFYSAYYNPAHAIIVVVGDFRKETLLPQIEKAFGLIPSPPAPERNTIEDPPQKGERRIRVERPAQVGAVIAAYHVPNLRASDAYVLEVIQAILSSGKSSRLYDHLVRGKEVVLEASADYNMVSQDPGLFYISGTFLPHRNGAEVEKALYEELELLKTVPVEPRELEKAKNQIEASFVLDQDSLFTLGMNLATYEIAYDWRAIGNYVPSIRSVTPDEILRVAAKYFTPLNRTVGVLVPTGPAKDAPAPPMGGMKERMIR